MLHGRAATVALLEALGVPYSWGGGEPASAWPYGGPGIIGGYLQGATGWDCSGYAQSALVRIGRLSASAPDRSAAALEDAARAVVPGQQQVGDLCFYGSGSGASHVTVVLTEPGPTGNSYVIGANGGRSHTNGDDPKARVSVKKSMAYRSDYRGVGRLVEDLGPAERLTVGLLPYLQRGELLAGLQGLPLPAEQVQAAVKTMLLRYAALAPKGSTEARLARALGA